jgi:CheY-like chemotaxis protein
VGTLDTPIEVLLVEDNPGDVELVERAVRNSDFHLNMTVAMDGEEAMTVLRQEGDHADSPRPDLVLLDLNLPKKDGRQVLSDIRSDPELKNLLDLNLPKKDGRQVLSDIRSDPELKNLLVVVLTSSPTQEDLLKAYDLHSNGYVSKPVDSKAFDSVVKDVLNYWFNVSRLPRNN